MRSNSLLEGGRGVRIEDAVDEEVEEGEEVLVAAELDGVKQERQNGAARVHEVGLRV